MKIVFVLSIFISFALPLWAAPSKVRTQPEAVAVKPAPPSGPLLRPPADFSRWEITSTYPDEQKKTKQPRKGKVSSRAADARPRMVVTTKTGRIICEERTDILHRTVMIWSDARSQYVKYPDDSQWYKIDRTGPDAMARPLPAIGYRDMDLIKEENYAGTTLYNNQNCLVFLPGGYLTANLAGSLNARKKLDSLVSVAYVDADSRQPVAVRTRTEFRTFQFDLPPTEMQTLPIDLIAQIKKGEDGRGRLSQPASRPY